MNTYRSDNSHFIGGDTLLLRKGTTQGDPLAMVMFAVASIPLIKELSAAAAVKQLWYVNDVTRMGSLHKLRKWWDKINVLEESYGYYPNAVKNSLLVRENLYDKACECLRIRISPYKPRA